ncbi:EAL domain-containing protein [Photobacterium sp. ZSDE20]|uniref:EAL domain-containing protein n=1 Tax=Photobacterium pectinilyticum TaxID=2906793 RepID=A0ABT1NCJ5_9GAMM|nr:EAL domain-containing protein [Photobacterium sp. ZSDE20]MCQ1061059.1 EAL domain-containing protein [Photobacterium sp. ZSDE20]MDD1829153.1 EAL domain-containing protein [Photobacterium sp. ZSDE20]
MDYNKINTFNQLSGSPLFETIGQSLYEAYAVDAVLIGSISEDREGVHILSSCFQGERGEEHYFPLIEVPETEVVETEEPLIISSDFDKKYPLYSYKHSKSAETFIGIPLFARNHQLVGVLSCLFKRSFHSVDALLEYCNAFATYLGYEVGYEALLMRQSQLQWQLEEGQKVAKVGSWNWNLQDKYFEWSKEVYRIYGIKDESLLPTLSLLSALIHPEDREWVLDTLYRSIESDSVNYNLVHRVQLWDGTIKYVRKRAEVIRNSQGQPVEMRGTIHDVTDVYQISAKLNKTSRQLTTTFNSVEEGIWEFDLERREFATSAKFWHLLGREKPKEGDGLDVWLSCIVEEDRGEGVDYFCRFIQQQHASVFQFEFRLKASSRVALDGNECWLTIKGSVVARDDNGKPIKVAGIQRDITHTIEAKRQLDRAQVVFDNTSECILITDKNNKIISVNRSFEEITGYREKELLGLSPSVLSSGIHDAQYYHSLWHNLNSNGHWKGEVWNRRKNGEIYPEEISINVIRDDSDEIVNFVAVFRDISHWKKAEEQLTFFAYKDPLTSLVNRRSFIQRVKKHIASIDDIRGQTFSLLFIDMDDFKSLNDLYGHDFGDKVLVHIANCLKRVFPVADNICRYGGDEFCVLLPKTTSGAARIWGQQVVDRVAEAFVLDDIEVNTTVSIGISTYPESGETHSELLKNADYAMYNMKGQGRNGICQYDSALQSDYIEKLRMRDRLKKAISDELLMVYYQPVVDARTGKISRFEALIRWHDEVEGHISPAEFIPVAERYGLIRPLGAFVLHQVCRDLKQLHQAGFSDVTMSINRSVKEFIGSHGLPPIWEVIESYGLPLKSIVVEITESTASSESSDIQSLLASYKQRGIEIALDDFGTGYSSLSSVVELRPNIIKIDRSFIKEIDKQDNRTLVSLIIDLSHKLGIQVVAEGVETRKQLDILREMHCHFVQGFLFSPAVPFTRCFSILKSKELYGLPTVDTVIMTS